MPSKYRDTKSAESVTYTHPEEHTQCYHVILLTASPAVCAVCAGVAEE